jgi:hypothetical protein
MTGLSLVKSSSKSMSLNPCGCSVSSCSFIRLTTLTTRILRSGKCSPIIAHQQQRCRHFRYRIARNINSRATGDSVNSTSAVSPTGVTRVAFTSPARARRGRCCTERPDLRTGVTMGRISRTVTPPVRCVQVGAAGTAPVTPSVWPHVFHAEVGRSGGFAVRSGGPEGEDGSFASFSARLLLVGHIFID